MRDCSTWIAVHLTAVLLLAPILGCSLNTLVPTAGEGGSPDAGAVDIGSSDVGRRDTGDATLPDGEGFDGARPDVPLGCTRADQRCDRNVRQLCRDGNIEDSPCPENQHCVLLDQEPSCENSVCESSSRSCSTDGASVLVCSESGSELNTVPCDRGCTGGDCRPETSCDAAIAGQLIEGSAVVDLCDHSRSHDYILQGDCAFMPTSEDAMFRLELDRTRRVRIDTRQSDPDQDVDPAVYIRRSCMDPDSQIVCDEDSGTDQDSHIDISLDAGDYFVVVDSDDWSTYRCGPVEVTLRLD